MVIYRTEKVDKNKIDFLFSYGDISIRFTISAVGNQRKRLLEYFNSDRFMRSERIADTRIRYELMRDDVEHVNWLHTVNGIVQFLPDTYAAMLANAVNAVKLYPSSQPNASVFFQVDLYKLPTDENITVRKTALSGEWRAAVNDDNSKVRLWLEFEKGESKVDLIFAMGKESRMSKHAAIDSALETLKQLAAVMPATLEDLKMTTLVKTALESLRGAQTLDVVTAKGTMFVLTQADYDTVEKALLASQVRKELDNSLHEMATQAACTSISNHTEGFDISEMILFIEFKTEEGKAQTIKVRIYNEDSGDPDHYEDYLAINLKASGELLNNYQRSFIVEAAKRCYLGKELDLNVMVSRMNSEGKERLLELINKEV